MPEVLVAGMGPDHLVAAVMDELRLSIRSDGPFQIWSNSS